jgi:hypothetical protein
VTFGMRECCSMSPHAACEASIDILQKLSKVRLLHNSCGTSERMGKDVNTATLTTPSALRTSPGQSRRATSSPCPRESL